MSVLDWSMLIGITCFIAIESETLTAMGLRRSFLDTLWIIQWEFAFENGLILVLTPASRSSSAFHRPRDYFQVPLPFNQSFSACAMLCVWRCILEAEAFH
jgi:hypothetical protein